MKFPLSPMLSNLSTKTLMYFHPKVARKDREDFQKEKQVLQEVIQDLTFRLEELQHLRSHNSTSQVSWEEERKWSRCIHFHVSLFIEWLNQIIVCSLFIVHLSGGWKCSREIIIIYSKSSFTLWNDGKGTWTTSIG